MITGAREARPSWLRRLMARAGARELSAFVVPGPDVVRARGIDVEAAGLRIAATPRHAGVLLIVGEIPEGLREAAAVAYAQMVRPRAVFAVGAGDVSPLPHPDVLAPLHQGAVADGVARLRRSFAEGTFNPEATGFDVDALRTETQYVCPMHPEVIQDEPGSCPVCGMDLAPREEAGEDATHQDDEAERDGHGGTDHGAHGEADDDHEMHGNANHEGMDHEHMDHGGMGFMSMVEMTKDLPRSSDGLQMEWVEAPFGPLFPGLPGGLGLTLTLDGDTVAQAEATPRIGERVFGEGLAGPAETFANRLARLDPLVPVAYRCLALRAFADTTVTIASEREGGSIGALERERAASHLNWLAQFGYLIGDGWISRRAAELQLSLLHARDAGEVARLEAGVRKFVRWVEKTPLLRRRLEGIGSFSPVDTMEVSGPIARAGGSGTDARADDPVYSGLTFEPVVREGNNALSRLRVRLAEVVQSLELVRAAGSISVPDRALEDIASSGKGTATVETPRGRATLNVTLEEGTVTLVELDTPSTRHLDLVKLVAEGEEFADALVGISSLDLSPWEVTE